MVALVIVCQWGVLNRSKSRQPAQKTKNRASEARLGVTAARCQLAEASVGAAATPASSWAGAAAAGLMPSLFRRYRIRLVT